MVVELEHQAPAARLESGVLAEIPSPGGAAARPRACCQPQPQESIRTAFEDLRASSSARAWRRRNGSRQRAYRIVEPFIGLPRTSRGGAAPRAARCPCQLALADAGSKTIGVMTDGAIQRRC